MNRPIILSLLLATMATSVGGQTVTGRVTADTDGAALRGVSVLLIRGADEIATRVLTDETGLYRMSAPAGDYRVVADHLGYQRLESPLMKVAIDQTVTIDFELPIDPVEVEGVKVEVERREELRRRVAQYGVDIQRIGSRFVPRGEIERRGTALNIGEVLQWQNWAGVRVEFSNTPPSLCVQFTRGRARCVLTVLDGAVVDDEFAASIPPEMLEAVILLTPMEATLSFGTGGGGGAVLLFTRMGLARR